MSPTVTDEAAVGRLVLKRRSLARESQRKSQRAAEMRQQLRKAQDALTGSHLEHGDLPLPTSAEVLEVIQRIRKIKEESDDVERQLRSLGLA